VGGTQVELGAEQQVDAVQSGGDGLGLPGPLLGFHQLTASKVQGHARLGPLVVGLCVLLHGLLGLVEGLLCVLQLTGLDPAGGQATQDQVSGCTVGLGGLGELFKPLQARLGVVPVRGVVPERHQQLAPRRDVVVGLRVPDGCADVGQLGGHRGMFHGLSRAGLQPASPQ